MLPPVLFNIYKLQRVKIEIIVYHILSFLELGKESTIVIEYLCIYHQIVTV